MTYSQHMLLQRLAPIRWSRLHRHHRFRSARTSERDAPKHSRSHDPAGRRCNPLLGALELFERGVSSTWPSNRSAWRWLEDRVQLQQHPSAALLELLVDPQTCGPLLLACNRDAAIQLTRSGPWIQIGSATAAHG